MGSLGDTILEDVFNLQMLSCFFPFLYNRSFLRYLQDRLLLLLLGKEKLALALSVLALSAVEEPIRTRVHLLGEAVFALLIFLLVI